MAGDLFNPRVFQMSINLRRPRLGSPSEHRLILLRIIYFKLLPDAGNSPQEPDGDGDTSPSGRARTGNDSIIWNRFKC